MPDALIIIIVIFSLHAMFVVNRSVFMVMSFIKGLFGKPKLTFAPSDQIEALRPFVDEFWTDILGTSYSTSFVSNGSMLSVWDHYLSGGREELIQKVKDKYGVDISDYYDEPIPVVLTNIKNER